MRALQAEQLTHALIQNPDWESVGRDMAWVETSNHYIITWEDESYPRLLKDIPDPPLVLLFTR